jgi:hypothetical protein
MDIGGLLWQLMDFTDYDYDDGQDDDDDHHNIYYDIKFNKTRNTVR